MSKYRRAAKVDNNQKEIVDQLRAINGVTVETDMDDILVGYKNKNFWFEIKNPETVSKKTGKVRESGIKEGQKKLRENWSGHYSIVWSIEQILKELKISEV